MRDLIVTQNITVDGVIEAGDWFGPADGGPEVLEALREQMARADAFLTGRVTFEQLRGFWPKQTDDPTGISAYLNQVQKYVVSSTLHDPGWQPTTIFRDLDEVRRLKDTAGGDIEIGEVAHVARGDGGAAGQCDAGDHGVAQLDWPSVRPALRPQASRSVSGRPVKRSDTASEILQQNGIERGFERTTTTAFRQNREAEPDLEDRHTCRPEIRGQLPVKPTGQERAGDTFHQSGNDVRIEQDQGSNLAGRAG